MGTPSQSYGMSLAVWDHRSQCYLPPDTSERAPLTPAMQAGTRFTYPGGIEGSVDLVDLIAPRPGVEPATSRSRFRRRTAAPPKQESLAIAKTTARCAEYMGALKSFESPRKRPRLFFPKFVKGFCSDRY